MCGCDCCQNGNPTCFDKDVMNACGTYHGWVCKCSCPNCISNVILGAIAVGVMQGVRSGREGAKADAPSHPYDDGFALGRATGRAEALDAARDAVAGLEPFDHEKGQTLTANGWRGRFVKSISKAAALAAIDGLKEKP